MATGKGSLFPSSFVDLIARKGYLYALLMHQSKGMIFYVIFLNPHHHPLVFVACVCVCFVVVVVWGKKKIENEGDCD